MKKENEPSLNFKELLNPALVMSIICIVFLLSWSIIHNNNLEKTQKNALKYEYLLMNSNEASKSFYGKLDKIGDSLTLNELENYLDKMEKKIKEKQSQSNSHNRIKDLNISANKEINYNVNTYLINNLN